MNLEAPIGWALAVAVIAIGWVQWGWPGVVLAITVIVFWLLLQFSRALRVLRRAGANPMGQVPSALMLHARLQRGQRLPHILAFTRSLGIPVAGELEAFEWRDGGGDTVRVELRAGRLERWSLQRADVAAAPDAPHPSVHE